jgi:peptide/nickel transport system permease protein
MIFQADSADAIREAWWWVLPPGLAIILLVMSVFFISRALEKMVHPSLRHR